MSALELIQYAVGGIGGGVLAGGLGLLKWGIAVERRLIRVEMKTGVAP